MRSYAAPSEIASLAAPLLRLFDAAWQRMHWWIAAMALLYLLSGITIVHPDQVAVVLRWGRLVGATPALQEHGPGLLFALPRPVDSVVRVNVKKVRDLKVNTLADMGFDVGNTLDPITQGYAVTGDMNIVHVKMVAHYRVRDPAEWAFYGPVSSKVLRAEVTAAMVRSLGEMGIDSVLSDGRKELVAKATRRAQAGLDAARSGLELTSLELVSLSPPNALTQAFNAVQSAYIGAETSKKKALAFAANAIPKAQADANTEVQSARSDAEAALATASGDTAAFLAMEREYKRDPVVVRERLYRDAVDEALGDAGQIRWIPPPSSTGYNGLRIDITPAPAGWAPGRAQQGASGGEPLRDVEPPAVTSQGSGSDAGAAVIQPNSGSSSEGNAGTGDTQ